MADQPKKKNPNAVVANTERPNRKAVKTSPDAIFRHGKEYRGSHTRKSPQSPVQKVLLGQGAYRHIAKRIDGTNPTAWKLPTGFGVPYDKAQVEVNKRLYPHLFTER